jgi:uncharacterized membrane protein
MDRLLSTVGGAALLLFGLSRGKALGLGLALAGGALVYRALAGHCHVFDALGLNTSTRQGTASAAELAYRHR